MDQHPLTIDPDFLNRLTADLVRINSTNPSLSPTGKGEKAIALHVAGVLSQLGLEVRTDEVAPGRMNVVGLLPGQGGGRTLLLNAHLDTVGVEGMKIDPFGAEVREGRMYGRGTQDMKASLAAMIAAAKALIESDTTLAGDLLITAVADEEHSSIGMEALVQKVTADAAIVTEPTDMHLCRAHRGFIWFDIETTGRAAHGSRYAEGIDANMHMGRVLGELEKLGQALLEQPGHPLAGPPSLHAARLRGGSCRRRTRSRRRRTARPRTPSSAVGEVQGQRVGGLTGPAGGDGLGRVGVEVGEPLVEPLGVTGDDAAGPSGQRQRRRTVGRAPLHRAVQRLEQQLGRLLLRPLQGALRARHPDAQAVLHPGRGLGDPEAAPRAVLHAQQRPRVVVDLAARHDRAHLGGHLGHLDRR